MSVDARAGTETGGINIVVAPVRQRHVRGVVLDGATGETSWRTPRWRSRTPSPSFGGSRESPEVSPNTGAFDVVLLPGTHTLTATSEAGIGSATFQLGDNDLENVTIVVSPRLKIAGRIAVDGASPTVAELGELRITLAGNARQLAERRRLRTAVRYVTEHSILTARPATSASNRSDFECGSSGISFARAAGPAKCLCEVDPTGKPRRIERRPSFERTAGQHTRRCFGYEARFHRRRGDERQQTAGQRCSVVWPRMSALVRICFFNLVSDSSGRFRFDRVPPGDYKMFAWSEVENGSWYDPDFMKTYEDARYADSGCRWRQADCSGDASASDTFLL